MNGGTSGLQVDVELLKLLATVFALFVSTVTVEFRIAAFVNSKRDCFPDRRLGQLSTVGEVYDWFWGYLLGLFVNVVFLLVAHQVHLLTRESDYTAIGDWVYRLYLLNVILWAGGFIIDALRLAFPGAKRDTTNAESGAVVTQATARTPATEED